MMITNLEEGGKNKCQQYWPDSRTRNFGPFQVSMVDERILADYTIRILTVQVFGSAGCCDLVWMGADVLLWCPMQLSGSSERPLKLTHFHFTTWPDHGVPDFATSILAFHKRVKKEHKSSKGPMVVHCR